MSLTILGAGGHAKVAISVARAMGVHVSQVLDDCQSKWGQQIMGVEVIGPVDLVTNMEYAHIAIGRNSVRALLAERFDSVNWVSLCHPSSCIDPTATLEPGCLVCAGAVIQPEALIARHSIINTRASVDHECRLEEFSQAAPGSSLGGNVRVGAWSYVGIGASVHQQVSIGQCSFLGGGSFLRSDMPSFEIWGGVPAKYISHISRFDSRILEVAELLEP